MAHQHDPATAPQSEHHDEEQMENIVVHFSLTGLLPQEHILALHRFLGTLSHLTLVQERPSLLLPQLEQFPYEMLWASFHGSTSEKAIARARTRLQRASEEGYWDEEMRPLRTMHSRARLKLQEMGLDIVSLFETGYLLTRHYRRRLRRKTNENGDERDAPR